MKLFRTTLIPTLMCWLALLFALAAFSLPPASAAPMHRAARHSAKHRFHHNADYRAGYRAGYHAGYRAGRSHKTNHRGIPDPPGGGGG